MGLTRDVQKALREGAVRGPNQVGNLVAVVRGANEDSSCCYRELTSTDRRGSGSPSSHACPRRITQILPPFQVRKQAQGGHRTGGSLTLEVLVHASLNTSLQS